MVQPACVLGGMGLIPSPQTSGSIGPSVELAKSETASAPPPPPPKPVKRENNNRKGTTSSSEHEGPKTADPKTLRRLAQNRERKSRLRKKAYVQQLESSRIKLNQLEQELHVLELKFFMMPLKLYGSHIRR